MCVCVCKSQYSIKFIPSQKFNSALVVADKNSYMQEMLQFSLHNDDDAQGGQILLKINPEMRRRKG